MFSVIPRGRVYHPLLQDAGDFFRALFSKRDVRKVRVFEEKLAEHMNVKHALTFPYARTAFYFALKAAGIPPGSEIIMPPITIKPFLDLALIAGLKPVFVDLDPETMCYDCDQLEKAITPNTKAINITYLFGMVPDMERLFGITKRHHLFVVEDFSHNIHAEFRGKKLGTFGDVGIYSASSIKTFDIHGAGLLFTNNAALADRLKGFQSQLQGPPKTFLAGKIRTTFIRNLATQRLFFSLITYAAIWILKKISRNDALKFTGSRAGTPIHSIPEDWMYAFDPLQAEFGLRELPRVSGNDQKRIANVRQIKAALKAAGKPLSCPVERDDSKCVFWQFATYRKNAVRVQDLLHQHAVDTATTSLVLISSLPAYPCHKQMPVAQRLHDNTLLVPAYPSLSPKDIERIIEALKNIEE